MMADDEQRSTGHSTRTSISKLKHDSTEQRRHHTNPATGRSGGRGQRATATPLIPGKARGTVELEDERVKEREGGGHGRFGLDVEKLQSILRGYGEYPAKYRSLILGYTSTDVVVTKKYPYVHRTGRN